MLEDRLSLSERRACAIAGQHRSTQRHEPKLADGDQALRRRLREISANKPRWGCGKGGGTFVVLRPRLIGRRSGRSEARADRAARMALAS
jgi:hypothetical protein